MNASVPFASIVMQLVIVVEILGFTFIMMVFFPILLFKSYIYIYIYISIIFVFCSRTLLIDPKEPDCRNKTGPLTNNIIVSILHCLFLHLLPPTPTPSFPPLPPLTLIPLSPPPQNVIHFSRLKWNSQNLEFHFILVD